ncbi:MAG: hypothetical protein ACLRSW_10060 [Christensenellaceae bacterium]
MRTSRGHCRCATTQAQNTSLPAYTDDTGRNDIVNTRVVYDEQSITFLVTCAEDITDYGGDKTWMNNISRRIRLVGNGLERLSVRRKPYF